MSDPSVIARLEIVAAKATIAAEQYKNNKYWPGELTAALNEIQQELDALYQRANRHN
jgi:hypothetical protein